MCMEDVRIGRKTRSVTRVVTVGATAVLLSGLSRDRVALVISPPISTALLADFPRITISNGNTVVDSVGYIIEAGSGQQSFDIQTHGAFITDNIYAISNGGNLAIGIIETFLNEQ